MDFSTNKKMISENN